MSRENVEIVRGLYEAVGRRDTEAVLSAYDPNVEIDFSGGPLASLIGDTVYRGHDEIRKMVRDRYVGIRFAAGAEDLERFLVATLAQRATPADPAATVAAAGRGAGS